MTRQTQKDTERRTLDALLVAFDLVPNRIDEGEQPDFLLSVSGRTIGVEVTMYQSGTTVGAGLGRRQVESEWEVLQRASEAFRKAQPDILNVNAGLMFKDIVPGRKEHQAFMAEVAAFMRNQASRLARQDAEFWPRDFASPLMAKYLRTLYLRTDEFAVWHSNVTAGYVALPDYNLAAIVNGKATKTYRSSDELWLVIQCSHRVSETVLQINGVADYEMASGLTAAMQSSPFSKVCVIAIGGIFQWERAVGWTNIAPDQTASSQGPTLDELKALLNDPEWLVDPVARGELEARRVLQEFQDGKLA